MSSVIVRCTIVHETHKAYCVEITGIERDVWFPKRFARVVREGLIVPVWLAIDRGIPPLLLQQSTEKPLHGWEQ